MGTCVDAISPEPSAITQMADAISHVGHSRYYCRQRPTLPHSFPCSTIGGIRLNFRVRNGNGCDPDPMTTGILVCLGSGFTRRRSQAAHNARSRSSQTIFSQRIERWPFFKEPTEYSANGSFARPFTSTQSICAFEKYLW